MAGLKLVCIAVVCMVLASASVDEAISCGQVSSYLAPCVSYVRSSGVDPVPSKCCDGIRNLNNEAKTTPDRQEACRCIKKTAFSIKGINYGIVASLPGKCRVSIPYKLSPDTNCDSVK